MLPDYDSATRVYDWLVNRRELHGGATLQPGFSAVFMRDRFLAIWTMLHCVDEEGASIDKGDKIYKSTTNS